MNQVPIKSMDEDSSDIPIEDFNVKHDLLMNTIKSDPLKAWGMLQEDPLMVVVFPSVKRDLEGVEDENVTDFLDEYDQKVKLILGEDNSLERYGIALTTEFLTEYWRRTINSTELSSVNEAILRKLATVMEATDQLPDGDLSKIIHRIVDYSTHRIIDFSDYDRMKAGEHVEILSEQLDLLVENVTSGDRVSDELLSLSYFASASVESIEVLRNRLALKLLTRLKTLFTSLPSEEKFTIAPWIGVFEQITHQDQEEE